MNNQLSPKTISIVIPIYNEEEVIAVLIERLLETLSDRFKYEIIIVDDGSHDNSMSVVHNICTRHDNVFYISFSRNFGHQNAIRAGIDYATGDAVITMDGDMQHPPEIIPKMIDKWSDGFEIVLTVREESKDLSLLKRYTSKLYYDFLNRIADISLSRGAADFRLLDRKVVNSLKSIKERGIFYRGMMSWLGYRQFQVKYTPNPRMSGVSKYSLKRMVSLGIDGVTSFSVLPLRLATILGGGISFFSFVYALYALYIKFFTDDAVLGWLSVMAGIYFLGGIQLVFLGLHGEYLGKIFLEVKNRPNYIVSKSNLPQDNHKFHCST